METPIPRPDRCIACTACTVVCPVARANPDFLGPRMSGPAHERFRILGIGEDEALHYCSNCKNCDIACPCDVPVSAFIMRARAEGRDRPLRPRDWALAHGETLARLLRFAPASLKNFGMNLAPVRRMLHCLGIARYAPLPAFAPKTFRERFADYAQPKGLPKKAVIFPGCFVDIYEPECGLDMVAVLNTAGYEALVPEEFVCCGLPLAANGFWEEARRNAAVNMNALGRWRERGLPVVTGCPSCALTVTRDYREYFPDLPPRGFSPALADACEFLLDAVREKALPLPPEVPARPVLYHAPCHLRAQGIGLPGLDLLREAGLSARNADAGCCGLSGSYGFKADKYAIAMRVGEGLFTAIKDSAAAVCASECGICRVQMRHGGQKPALHPVSLLKRRLEGGAL